MFRFRVLESVPFLDGQLIRCPWRATLCRHVCIQRRSAYICVSERLVLHVLWIGVHGPSTYLYFIKCSAAYGNISTDGSVVPYVLQYTISRACSIRDCQVAASSGLGYSVPRGIGGVTTMCGLVPPHAWDSALNRVAECRVHRAAGTELELGLFSFVWSRGRVLSPPR